MFKMLRDKLLFLAGVGLGAAVTLFIIVDSTSKGLSLAIFVV